MKKKEFAKLISENIGITEKAASKFIDKLLPAFVDILFECGELNIPGFIKLKLIVKENKSCVNPRTGESIIKPISIVVKFRPLNLFHKKLHSLGARMRSW